MRSALTALLLLALAAPASAQDAGVPAAPADEAPPEPPPDAPEDEAPEAEPAPPEPPPPRMVPPRIVRSSPPEYPESRLGEHLHPSVVLIVTLDPSGQVVDAEVEHSADPDFDAAAQAAVRTWEFAAAQREGQPIASRVRVAVHFELPAFDLATGAEPVEGGAVVEPVEVLPDHPQPQPETEVEPVEEAEEAPEPAEELGVTAAIEHEVRDEDRGASSFEIDRDVLASAPRQEGADLLLSVPGVFAARAEGMAVGHRINLRGFDAEHGQDIELSVGGLPINLPSHVHGQGYADLGLLIPEAVRRVRATEGVYDPRQGDFAVAGSIAFDLGVPEDERGFRVQSGYGLYDTFEQLVLWAPEGEREETFGAVQYRRTGGYGQRRQGDAISAIVQAGARSGDWRLRGLGILYGARANLAGVIRVDDLEAERIGYYDAYGLPTAQSQSATSGRFLAGFFADHRSDTGAGGGVGLWIGGDLFRVQENFTGFTRRSRSVFTPTGRGVAGRGDLIEQRNRTMSAGLNGRFRTAAWTPWDWASARLELGLDGRVDFVEQAQNLLDAEQNRTWDELIDADVFAANTALWGDVELQLTDLVTVHAGARAALVVYEIDDRLGNFIEAERRESFLVGYRRSAGGVTAGPRASVEVKPLEILAFRAAYGHGYRSPQARTLADGETAPFTEVRSADLGAVLELDRALRVQVAGFWTELSDDIAFEPREGRLERIGATRRIGAVLHAQARPLDWLIGALSVTYVDAELLEPPPGTASDPQPAFEPGQNLPYVPPVVIRADLGARGTLVDDVLGQKLRGHVGAGYSFLSPRPLPFGGFADPVSLFDASAGLGWGPVDLDVSFFNLFDVRYAASEFVFASSWDPDAIPSRVPARHLAAGSPFTFMVTLGISP
ncbi:MAG: TonB-dependent receptor [Myxococcota bacterium]|nr:TonB-dependent receptor [Myxococcota bacterium]